MTYVYLFFGGLIVLAFVCFRKPRKSKYTVTWKSGSLSRERNPKPIPPGHYRVRDCATGETRDVRIKHPIRKR
jgi:hypothetical protein